MYLVYWMLSNKSLNTVAYHIGPKQNIKLTSVCPWVNILHRGLTGNQTSSTWLMWVIIDVMWECSVSQYSHVGSYLLLVSNCKPVLKQHRSTPRGLLLSETVVKKNGTLYKPEILVSGWGNETVKTYISASSNESQAQPCETCNQFHHVP